MIQKFLKWWRGTPAIDNKLQIAIDYDIIRDFIKGNTTMAAMNEAEKMIALFKAEYHKEGDLFMTTRLLHFLQNRRHEISLSEATAAK